MLENPKFKIVVIGLGAVFLVSIILILLLGDYGTDRDMSDKSRTAVRGGSSKARPRHMRPVLMSVAGSLIAKHKIRFASGLVAFVILAAAVAITLYYFLVLRPKNVIGDDIKPDPVVVEDPGESRRGYSMALVIGTIAAVTLMLVVVIFCGDNLAVLISRFRQPAATPPEPATDGLAQVPDAVRPAQAGKYTPPVSSVVPGGRRPTDPKTGPPGKIDEANRSIDEQLDKTWGTLAATAVIGKETVAVGHEVLATLHRQREKVQHTIDTVDHDATLVDQAHQSRLDKQKGEHSQLAILAAVIFILIFCIISIIGLNSVHILYNIKRIISG